MTNCSVGDFKSKLDSYSLKIPDQPNIRGYTTNNVNSNSIVKLACTIRDPTTSEENGRSELQADIALFTWM